MHKSRIIYGAWMNVMNQDKKMCLNSEKKKKIVDMSKKKIKFSLFVKHT